MGADTVALGSQSPDRRRSSGLGTERDCMKRVEKEEEKNMGATYTKKFIDRKTTAKERAEKQRNAVKKWVNLR